MKGERTDFGLYKSSADPLWKEPRMNEKRYSGRDGGRREGEEERGEGRQTHDRRGEMDHNYVEWTERRMREAKNRQGRRGKRGRRREMWTTYSAPSLAHHHAKPPKEWNSCAHDE